MPRRLDMISGLFSFYSISMMSPIKHIKMAYLNCYLMAFILNALSVILYGEKIVYWDPYSILDSRTTHDRSHIEVPSCGTLLVLMNMEFNI